MKKTTLKSLVSYLNGEAITNLDEIKAELEAELAKNAGKAEANRKLYEEAREIVLSELGDTPATAGELYEAVADKLPEGFTKAKVQYALTHYWEAYVVKHEGKVNTYTKA